MLTVKCKRCAIFGELCALFLVRVVVFVYFCEVGTALKIQNFSVPQVVNMKSSEPIRLECTIEYNSEDNFSVLVAQWFINTTLLYQWSPARPSPYINKKYINRFEPNSVNRTHITNRIIEIPLTITEKAKDLSGTYRCVAETFLTQDSNESYMKMYAPVDNITLNKVFDNATNELNVTCMAKDVYPKPEINLFINDEENITNTTELEVEENEREYFDISATYILSGDKLQSSIKINCSIAIPEIRVFSAQTHFSKSGLEDNGDGSGDGSGDGDDTNVDVNANVTEKYDTKGAADWSSKRINFNLLLASTLVIVLFDHFVH